MGRVNTGQVGPALEATEREGWVSLQDPSLLLVSVRSQQPDTPDIHRADPGPPPTS